MGQFNELKRRNVIRVGIAYLIVAWLLLQVADVMIDNIGAPDWLFQAILLVLAIGFVIALFFAWAFELTPEGLKRESEVDRSRSLTPTTGKKLNTAILVLLAVAVVYLLIDRFRQTPVPVTTETQSAEQSTEPVTPTQAQPSSEPSIAVLPFINMSNDPEQEYFSDGISEELLNLLVRVDGLQVASRTSSFTYKGENLDIPEIASELKVDHILEGSVRKAGNRVRITAQLIDAASDRHLWSDTFDRELDDIFAIQDEIANAIVSALRDTLGIGLEAVTVQHVTQNLDAYQLYLKARGLFIARQNLAESIRLFEQAIALDPGFAQAWEGLAATHSVAFDWLVGDGVDHLTLAEQAADRALAIDPELSMPYAVKGGNAPIIGEPHAYTYGVDMLSTAIEKDPKNATAWLWRGLLLKSLGYMKLAMADLRACLEVDPAYLNCKQHLAEALLTDGQEQAALQLLEETVAENFFSTTDAFVPYFLQRGQRLTALLLASTAIRMPYAPVKDWIDLLEHPDKDPAPAVARWQAWAAENGLELCDKPEPAIALRQYQCLGSDRSIRLSWFPSSAEYRKTSVFKEFARAKLLEYWRERGFPPQCRAIGEEDFECD
jgi:TolB-like protein/tetratricopeptide (TPR) repeat protein